MRKILIAIFALALAAAAQRHQPPEPIPPTGQLVVCQGPVVTALEAPQAIENLRMQGCNHIVLDYLTDGYYLMHGQKVVVQNP